MENPEVMTTLEKDTEILKTFIEESVQTLERGENVYVTGGYLNHCYKTRVLDEYCSKIVSKLSSLGYEYTTNHGHGCRDYKFSKKIDL